MLPQLAAQPSIAQAQSDDERARMHFQAGRSYFDQRRLEDALREFNEAYRLSDRAALLLNIATVLERLERLDDAADTVDRYLELEPDAEDRRTLTERAASMRAEAAEQRAAEEAAAAEETDTGPPTESSRDRAGPSNEGDGGGIGTLGLVGIIVAGVGVAAVVPTVAFGVISEDHYQRVQTECAADGTCPASVQGSLDEGPLFADISTGMLFVSIGLVAAGAALFTVDLISGDDGSAEASTDDDEASATARLDLGPGSLTLRGSF